MVVEVYPLFVTFLVSLVNVRQPFDEVWVVRICLWVSNAERNLEIDLVQVYFVPAIF